MPPWFENSIVKLNDVRLVTLDCQLLGIRTNLTEIRKQDRGLVTGTKIQILNYGSRAVRVKLQFMPNRRTCSFTIFCQHNEILSQILKLDVVNENRTIRDYIPSNFIVCVIEKIIG